MRRASRGASLRRRLGLNSSPKGGETKWSRSASSALDLGAQPRSIRDANAPKVCLAWLAVHDRSADHKAVAIVQRQVACARACHSPDDLINDVLERQLVERTAYPLTHHLPVPRSSSLRHAD